MTAWSGSALRSTAMLIVAFTDYRRLVLPGPALWPVLVGDRPDSRVGVGATGSSADRCSGYRQLPKPSEFAKILTFVLMLARHFGRQRSPGPSLERYRR